VTEPLQDSSDELARLRATQVLVEYTFQSRVPLLGPVISWFRQRWNDVSTTWYVRSLIDQQNRFNAATVDHLTAQKAHVDRQEARLRDLETSLRDQLADAAARLDEHHAQIEELWSRSRDHDAWLIETDQEQSGYVRDLAEVTLQLVQLNRQLHELGQQVSLWAKPPSTESRAPGAMDGAEHSEP
jgi:hypothetical protein